MTDLAFLRCLGRHKQLLNMLTVRGRKQEQLFAAARNARDSAFGKRAVVRGVIEVTSACVKSCLYCPMRVEGRIERYYKRPHELMDSVIRIREAGLGIVFFQGGEVRHTTRTIGEMIPDVRAEFRGAVEVLLCLGDKNLEDYRYLKKQGADSYIIKHETADPNLHESMRKVPLSERLECIGHLIMLGYRTGIGTIVGLPGQTMESLIDDILMPSRIGAVMTSASPFIPAPQTPLEHFPPGDIDLTLNVLALMRIANPDALIPTVSALERLSEGGQKRGFDAGANVITVNFTPAPDQARYPIYGNNRHIVQLDHAFRTLEAAGLEPLLGVDAYAFWETRHAHPPILPTWPTTTPV